MNEKIIAEHRFWGKVLRSEECWEWNGALSHDGYGHYRCGGKVAGAHRYSYLLHNGPIPDSLLVLHHCDNRKCVRPDHLFLGTHQDNAKDRCAKGRSATGTSHARAKITEREVAAIKEMCRRFPPTKKRSSVCFGVASFLGRWFGMGRGNILVISKNKTWRNT